MRNYTNPYEETSVEISLDNNKKQAEAEVELFEVRILGVMFRWFVLGTLAAFIGWHLFKYILFYHPLKVIFAMLLGATFLILRRLRRENSGSSPDGFF